MARKLDRASVEEILSLTPMQQGMLFHYLVTPESEMYFEQISFRIVGNVDAPLVRKAWNRVIENNPALRTVFRWNNVETPVQIILKQHSVLVREVDFTGLTEAQRVEKIEAMRVQDRQEKFDLEEVPFRVTLCKLDADEYEMIISNHHILYDGWSNTLLLKEFFQTYDTLFAGRIDTQPIKNHPKEFIKYLRKQDKEQQRQFWEALLDGFDRNTLLPYDTGAYRTAGNFELGDLKYEFSKEVSAKAHQFVKAHQMTLATLLYTVWGIVLQKHNQTNDVLFGTTVSGRTLEVKGIENMVGLFMNTVPLRFQVEPEAVIADVLRQVHEQVMKRDAFASTPLVEIKNYAKAHGQKQLFDCMVAVENFPLEGIFEEHYCLQIKSLTVFEMTNFDLSLGISVADPISVRLKYNANLFDEATIAKVAGQFAHILEQVMANPEARLADLEIVTPEEKQRLLVDFATESLAYPQEQGVHQRFEEQAAKTPDRIAVQFGEATFTYRELNARANQLAHFLRAQGIASDQLVGICMQRSLDLIVSLLAVFKAGCAYVPLDPAYPADRIAYMLEDSQVAFLLTQERLLTELPPHSAKVVCLDRDWAAIDQQASENLHLEMQTNALAYVIYTSGSTGQPKGVAIEHHSTMAFIEWAQQVFTAEQLRGVLASTSICFDLSIFEIFVPLSMGGKVILAENALYLPTLPAKEEVTLINTVPSAATELLRMNGIPSSVRTVNLAGEPLPNALAQQLYALEHVEDVYNLYGPSEDTTYSTYARVTKGAKTEPTIGRPIANTQAYVLDPQLQLVPAGVTGELYLGGDGLARGYLHRPELTAERFVPSPFAKEPGARMYKTGDLVRYLPDGTLEYLGRIDHQVKVRGFRIELSEIEWLLSQHPAVEQAVVLAREDVAGDKRLVAYVTASEDSTCDGQELRFYLKGKLPAYMVPSAFLVMERFPLTANGKIDKKAFPAPEQAAWTAEEMFVAPRSQEEELVSNIWAQVLHLGQVGVYDNFFELGGHSLLATQTVSRMREAFGVELPMRTLFDHPTVADVTAYLQALRSGERLEEAPLTPLERDGRELPLSFAQQRLWFLDRFMPNSALYNIPTVLQLRGDLQVTCLEQSLNDLADRHESLRTLFQEVQGQAVQVIEEKSEIRLQVVDLRMLPDEPLAAEVARLAKEEGAAPFDLSQGPLLRAKLLHVQEQEFVLLLTMHHIISDGWSIGVLLREWMAIYEAKVQGKRLSLPRLKIQYADYAVWQRDWLQGDVLEGQLSYWKQKLQGAEPLLQFPTDRPRPAVQTYNGATCTTVLPKSLGDRLNALSKQEGATLFMTLLASFKTLLYRYTMQEDLLVGSPIAGRNRSEIEGLIGFFVNTLVLRTDLSGQPSFKKLLSHVRETALEAYAHQDLPFEKIVDELSPERSLSYSPLFQTFFSLQNAPLDFKPAAGLNVKLMDADNIVTSKYDLSLYCMEAEDGLHATFEYNTDLFDESTILKMASHWETLLTAIVENPEQQVHALPMLGEEEQRQLAAWNETKLDGVPNGCIHQLFEAQAERTPDAVALLAPEQAMGFDIQAVMGDSQGTTSSAQAMTGDSEATTGNMQSLTYAELNCRANQLAHFLRRQGVKAGDLVGICTERTTEMVIGLLGILKSGAAYVPLDPNYPQDRIAYTLEDAQVAVLLTQDRLVAELPEHGAKMVRLDTDWDAISQESAENLPCEAKSNDLAYVIYTSGSTGRPKGVAIEHRSTMAFITWAQQVFTKEQLRGVLASTSICFDLSVYELFVTLSVGGKVILAENALYLPTLPVKDEVTLINTVPSAAAELVRMDGIPQSVRTVNLAGEPLPNALAQQLYALGHVQEVFNLYGPSEDTTYSTYALVEKGAETAPTIGRPIANTEAYLLDPNGQQVPIGVPGELYLAGDGLARGYLHRPDLTAERFVPNPFSQKPGARMYRTGDLARFLPNGELEYMGRIDHQVKVRGFRIELGEIEAVLATHPSVRETVVVVREDVPNEKRIVAYLAGEEQEIGAMRRFVKEKLPDYMVPSAFVWLEALPLTPNGKVDRKALPVPEIHMEVAQGTEPRTEIERILSEIWCSVLRLPQVGIADNFFELGGDSILSIQIVSKANQAGLRVTPKLMFQNQTIADLAASIEKADTTLLVAAEQGVVTGEVPLLPIQRWFFEQNFTNAHHWNQSMLLTVNQPLESAYLEQALRKALTHHDALRLRFEKQAGGFKQVNGDIEETVPLEVVDLSKTPETEQMAVLETLAEQAQASLSLTEGPLLRALYFNFGALKQGRLLLVIHHLAVDGVSWRILLEDLQKAYEQVSQGESIQLPRKTTSYKQWAERLALAAQADALQQELSYWLAQAEEPFTTLPLDHAEGVNREASMEEVKLSLTAEETRALLLDVPSAYRTQINDVLLTALVEAMAPWTGQRSLLVNLEGHGREEMQSDLDLSRTVGWFTTMYPLLLDLKGVTSLADSLKAIKEQVRRIPNKGIGYGLLRYLSAKGGAADKLSACPPAQISFNYLGQFDQALSGESLFGLAEEARGAHNSPDAKRSHVLDFLGVITGGQLHMSCLFSRELHDRSTMDRLMERYMEALRALIVHCQSPQSFGYTPSDFPLAKLNQQQLDKLLGAASGVENVYPMTPLQQGLLFHTLYAKTSGDYVVQLVLTYEGELRELDFERAWQQAISHHAILRTSFAFEGLEVPHQIVHRDGNVPFVHEDWRSDGEEAQEERLQSFLQADRAKGFDFKKQPMRLFLIRMAEDVYRLVWSYHHVLLDGWSLPLVLKDVYAVYNGLCNGTAVELKAITPYADYVAWLEKQDLQEAEHFWRDKLKGFLTPTPIGTGSGPKVEEAADEEAGKKYGRLALTFTEEQTKGLQEWARQHLLTLNTMVQGAFALLLSRYSGEADLVFGTIGAGRPPELPGVESMVGLFISTLPVRVQVPADAWVADWLKQLQAEQAELRQYEYSPLVNVQSWSEVPAGSPLFESLYVFENYLSAEESGEAQSGLRVTETTGAEQTSYPLTVIAVPGSRLSLRIMYDESRFDDVTVMRMLSHLSTLVEGIASHEEQRVADVPMLTAQEREQLLHLWNDTNSAYPRESTIVELFEAQAKATPDAIAVMMGDQSLTYGELNRRANQLAHALQKRGVRAEDLVGLCVERSLEMIVCMLGILKAGGAYVPLDPAYPQERLTYMLEDAQVSVLLTQERLVEKLPQNTAFVICVDADWQQIEQEPALNPVVSLTAESLAYVIYTSGSTGLPKGVCVPHRGVVRLVKNTDYVDFSPDRVFLQASTISFDAATFEIWGSLLNGAQLAMLPPHAPTLEELGQAIKHYGVTTLFITVALFNLMVENQLEALCQVKQLLFGGEMLSVPHVTKALQHGGTELISVYGPTESTTFTTFYPIGFEVLDRLAVPIGRPIANTTVYVLDAFGRLVPVGVPGELHIGGDGLAHGYLNRPELTAERFIQNPFSADPNDRLYKTGDLVRYLPGGNIDFIGRIDNQVKIRGFRIEPGEIEAVLLQHPDVQQTVVTVREEVPGNKLLVAYVVSQQDAKIAFALRQYLKDKLPGYMNPSAFVVLDSLPLTANGKVDKKALPAPDASQWAQEQLYVAPRNQAEELVANIWQGVLHVDQVGVHDNFFDLGGHSLLATQTVSRLREAFGLDVPLRTLFENPTVSELAAHLEGVRRDDENAKPLVRTEREGVDLPLSFAQQRLWFLDRFMPDSTLYNIPTVLQIEGDLDRTAWEASFQAVIDRHESLRTTFIEMDGKAVQRIAQKLEFHLRFEDLRGLAEETRVAERDRLSREDVTTPFDLTKGPLIRATLLQMEEQSFVLLLNMHHIISDGWSVGVFLRELTALYEAQVQSRTLCLPELPIQYVDFAVWQRDWLQGDVLAEQLSYWKQKLHGAQPLLQLPTDKPRPTVQSYRGATVSVILPNKLGERLHELSKQANATLYMTMLAAFKTLLYRYTMQEDILVGSPVAGRNRSEIEGLIGFFVNTLVLRSDLSGEMSFIELLAQVRETALEAYAHQDLPFEKIVDELQPERSLSYSPLFQVFFALQNALLDFDAVEGLNMRLVDAENLVDAKYDLSLYCMEAEDGFYALFEYSTDLFEESTILKMASHWETLLTAIVENPEQQIRALPMLGEEEQQQLQAWNETKLDGVSDGCIHQLFEAQAERTPDAVALVAPEQAMGFDRQAVMGDSPGITSSAQGMTGDSEATTGNMQSLTYAELNCRANQLAHFLRRQGVKAGDLVGICTERTTEMVIGLLGILKSGAAYVPLDPNYPQDRIAYTLEDAQVAVLLTQDRLVAELPEHGAKMVRLDTDWDAISQESGENLPCEAKSNDLAYVIYTSGSTGRPKGVAIEHRSTMAFITWAQQVFSQDQLRGVLASTSICFDLSVYELFVTLSVGGKVILAENALYLPTLPVKDEVTLINTVPSAATELVRMNGIPQSVLTVNLAGEPLPNALAQQLYGLGNVQEVYNLYGPSEDTTYSTYALVQKGAETAPTIGRPIANTQAYLLDPNGQQVPIGVPGELYLAGDGLARGYLHRLDLTAERFVANPFSQKPGARMYRTGDLARFLPNGELEYMGRIDHQVKVRGFRIELGEIETVLANHPVIREAVVIVREDKPGEKRIVAYLVGEEQEIGELRSFVKEKLPDYMVPSAFVWLEALPLTPNGKVDRKALPEPQVRVEVGPGLEPRTEIERILSEIWCSVLGLPSIGIYDNFFALGGDSILSIQIVSRANQAGLRMTPKHMFQNQTIAELAAAVEKNRDELPEILAEQGAVTGELPLLPIQQWFFEQNHPNPHHWNQSMMLTVKRALDPTHVEQALAALLLHHDALRLRFEKEAGIWKQVNTAPGDEVPLQVVDLSERPEAEWKQAIENAALEAQTGLDLQEGPMLRAVYFQLGRKEEARLLLVIHHMAVDGVSWRILLEDLQTALEQLRTGASVTLPPKTTSYKQWAEKLAEYAHSDALAEESSYWLGQNTAQVVRIPAEISSVANTEGAVEEVTLTLSVEETKTLLQEALSQHRASMDEVLLSALGRALTKWTRKGSYLIHLEGHGREEIVQGVDLSRTVGWFTTMYPVLLDLGNTSQMADALKTVKEGLRGIPNKGIGYGLLRYGDPNAADVGALRAKPQAEISFNYLGQFDQVVSGDSLLVTAPESSGPNLSPTAGRAHLLDFVAVIIGGELRVTCLYGTPFHKRQTIEALVRDLLEGVRWFVAPEPGRETFGYTSSDFPEADMDQASLNKVLKKLKSGKGR